MCATKLVISIKNLTYKDTQKVKLLNIDILEVIWLKYTRSWLVINMIIEWICTWKNSQKSQINADDNIAIK